MKTRLALRINAGAKRTQFAGRHGDGWKLRVAAPPVDGKANTAILKFLAKIARVPSSEVSIIAGQTCATKLIEIEGIDAASLHRAILMSNEESHAT